MTQNGSSTTGNSRASPTSLAFEFTRKRRRGYPSETHVRSGHRYVQTPVGDKDFVEKLGRNDLCPCGSGRRFQELLPEDRPLRRR
jgi:hypothetical protein